MSALVPGRIYFPLMNTEINGLALVPRSGSSLNTSPLILRFLDTMLGSLCNYIQLNVTILQSESFFIAQKNAPRWRARASEVQRRQ